MTVSDTNGHSATSTSTATVVPPLTVTAQDISAVEGTAFSGQVATGSFTGITGPFSAMINWGDGNSSSGTMTVSGNTFTVSGTHTYAEEGSYPLTVTVSDTSGHSAFGTSTATVGDAALTLTLLTVTAHPGRRATLQARFS